MYLKVRDVEFDDYTSNFDGTYWSQICKKCQKKHASKLGDLFDDHGGGACGVKGCDSPDEDGTVYVNIHRNEVQSIV